jgi:hypothetical protein
MEYSVCIGVSMSAQRFSTNEPASIEVYGRKSQVEAMLKNLSATGACLTWAQEGCVLGIGDLVCVTIELSRLKKRHKVNAEVVWRDGKEIGVNFIPPEELVNRFASRNR